MKMTRFKDIPQFTSDGCYQVNYPLTSLVKYIEEEIRDAGLQLNPEFQRGHVWTEEQQQHKDLFIMKSEYLALILENMRIELGYCQQR